jgi:hypothetical protein
MHKRFETMQRGASLIPVLDLLTLLTLAFLVTGGLGGKLLAQETNVEEITRQIAQKETDLTAKRQNLEALQQQLAHLQHMLATQGAELPKAADQQRVQEEIRKTREAMTKVQNHMARLAEDMATLTRDIQGLKQQLAAYAEREKQLQALTAEHKGRMTELERLKQEKQRQVQRLAEVQAQLAQAGGKGVTVASGAPMVQRDKVARQSYPVMLAEGKIFPITPEYYTGTKGSDGRLVIWPKAQQAGLTIQQALKADSPVMKEVTTAEFRRDGRVKMLVNPDSFDTFRVLRDALAKRGIDYGWEPYTGTKIFVSNTGRDIDSQMGQHNR